MIYNITLYIYITITIVRSYPNIEIVSSPNLCRLPHVTTMVPRKQTGLLECLGTRVLDLLPTNLRCFFHGWWDDTRTYARNGVFTNKKRKKMKQHGWEWWESEDHQPLAVENSGLVGWVASLDISHLEGSEPRLTLQRRAKQTTGRLVYESAKLANITPTTIVYGRYV